MSKLKVGDRVVATKPCDGDANLVGKSGAVERIDQKDRHLPYLVIWDCPVEYGSGEGDHAWWAEAASLIREAGDAPEKGGD